MPRLSVWAPQAREVTVVLGGPDDGGERAAYPMERGADGVWSRDVEAVEPLDYAFRVDGGEPTPDPRSAWQPHGVHGPSRWVDIESFSWTDTNWAGPQGGSGILGAVHYELHVGTFTPEGTLDAAIDRLGALVELGVDVVALMPVAAFPGRWGWGYDGVFPYAVHDGYGGPAALARFVDACHARGLGVSLDVVYNHLGPVGNYLARFGPYFTDRHHTPWGQAIDLDGPDAAHVRRFVIDSALRWLRDFHLDALRLDAVHEMHDDSERHLLAELSDEVACLATTLGRPLGLVAESDLNDPRMVTSTAEGGLGMTAQWADDVHHALHAALTGESQGYYADFAEVGALAQTLTGVFLHDGRWSTFRGREWGAPVATARIDGRRFLGYLQTHDQVGNRAAGDRIHDGLTPGRQAAGAALYLLWAGTPMIFMGEEWAASTPWQFFTDFDPADPIADAVRDGRRAEFAAHGWDAAHVPDPQDPATRESSVLRWEEREAPCHARMLDFYRALVAIRRAEPDLRDGRLDLVRVRHDDDELVLRRGCIAVVVNLAERSQTVGLEGAEGAGLLLAWHPESTVLEADGVRLGPHGSAVLRMSSTADG
ncbi:MAG TPA: malto-oligosyltrehalose trehalohydrolase [Dermatophilaceae bacterium]|nr:malto-oligosyltrehalose trehalohydrolase [Dermatophilaceae bacterium]